MAAALLVVAAEPGWGETITQKAERDQTATVPPGDPEMAAAMQTARRTLAKYLAQAAAPAPSMTDFAVKIGIRGKEGTEYFWISPFERRGSRFVGKLNNRPQTVTTVRYGQAISFARRDIVDWLYREDGRMKGNHTACALLNRAPKEDAEAFKQKFGLDCDTEAFPGRLSRQPRSAPQRRAAGPEMVSWVVLSNTHIEVTLDSLRRTLDELYPGEFLPPRERGNFVVEGAVPGAEFLINSAIPGSVGTFLLHSVPGPYTKFSDFAEHIKDPSLRQRATEQCCWLSVDLIGKSTDEEEAYRLIGGVLAKLAPADAAVLVHPSKPIALRFDDAIRRKLARGGLIP